MFLIETTRLIIKPISPNHLELLHSLYSDPEVMRYHGHGPKTPEEVQELASKMLNHQEKHGFGSGNIFEKETGAFVGRAGLIYVDLQDDQPDIEVGYLLFKPYWNKGYATELATALLNWGFSNLAVNKLVANVRSENSGSINVLKKIGMSYVGEVNCYKTVMERYEISKEQWKANNSPLSKEDTKNSPSPARGV